MDTTTTSALSSLTSSSSSTSSAKSASDLQTNFLNLLVTQLKNQDPTNPMDSAQMTSQLAQISTVSGIEKLNATISSLQQSYTTSQNMQATSLIGHTVMSPGNQLTLSASGAGGGLSLPSDADTVKVSIVNSSGTTVKTLSLGAQKAGTVDFVWDGTDNNGIAQTEGDGYTFVVTASQGSTTITPTALQMDSVQSVTLDSSGMKLNLGSGNKISYSDVKQVF